MSLWPVPAVEAGGMTGQKADHHRGDGRAANP